MGKSKSISSYFPLQHKRKTANTLVLNLPDIFVFTLFCFFNQHKRYTLSATCFSQLALFTAFCLSRLSILVHTDLLHSP